MEDKNKENVEEDFIATIKLITGEEILSTVSFMPDDDSLVLEHPMIVSKINNQEVEKNIRVSGFALQEWITSTFDQMFILPRKNILTMTEIEDLQIQNFYKDCVKKHTLQLDAFKETYEPKKFDRKMGRLGSIMETRKSLEDLFKKS
jgi:hypothetical protein|tara:strand:+ start:1339 stop:1779 length:441 start_codon:yes stop_codon:yes gene_type:complete